MVTFLIVPQNVGHLSTDKFQSPLWKTISEIGILAGQATINTRLAADDNNLPLQPVDT
jgi:hypothetical protein